MRQNRGKAAKIKYLREDTSDSNKNTHDAYVYAISLYRGVSAILKQKLFSLFFLNKIFERALHSRLISFFYSFKIIYEDHYGSLKNKFTQECYFYLNEKEHLISVFFLFQRGFRHHMS